MMAQKMPSLTIDVLDARANMLRQHYEKIPQIQKHLHGTFEDFRAEQQYDGIWARASLFFMPPEKLAGVLQELKKALKPDGILEFTFVTSKPEKGFDSFHPLPQSTMQQMVERSGFSIERILEENNTRYGEEGIEIPTYIVSARKPCA